MAYDDRRPIRLAVQSGWTNAPETVASHLAGQADLEVVGRSGTVGGLYALCRLHQPDACVLDIGRLAGPLLEQIRALHGTFPGIDLVVSYGEADPELIGAAVRSGIAALVPRAAGPDTVLRVIRQRAVVSAHPPGRLHLLTDRELAVVSLMGTGRNVSEMAGLLRISPHTVENHKRSIYAKLGVGNQSHAVSRAVALGLFDLSEPTNGLAPSIAPPGDLVRWPAEPGRPVLTVVRAPVGDCRDEVGAALLAGGVPFVLSLSRRSVAGDDWAQWHRGAVVCLLVDPDDDAWQLAAELGAPVLVVQSTGTAAEPAMDAVLHGARALLSRLDIASDLCLLLVLVARGYRALNPAHVRLLSDWVSDLIDRPDVGTPELTAREQEILASIACGHTVRQTARVLGIATKTVENTQARLFRKLGTHNRSETLIAAYRAGLLPR